MKKFAVIAFTFIFVLQTLAFAAFLDVDEATNEGKAIIRLYEKGIVNGTGDGYFRPNGFLTRSQFVKMVNKVFNYTHIGENKFTDIYEDKWYYTDVCIAAEMGYINGIGNGMFAPEALVTREQACVIINNILNMEIIPYYKEPSDYISPWAKDSVIKVISNRLLLLDDNGLFRAAEPMTRGEACEMLEKCILEDVGTIESIDLGSIAREELELRMNRVIKAMEEQVIPALEDETSQLVGQRIVDNMRSYLADSSHDYQRASQETFEIYKTIPKEKREIFKDAVQKYNKMEDLMLLYEFFYLSE